MSEYLKEYRAVKKDPITITSKALDRVKYLLDQKKKVHIT